MNVNELVPKLEELPWGSWIEAKFNRGKLALYPRIATPLIILGIATSILGTFGLLVAASGQQIPHLEFIAEHIPASAVLSLLMIRAGLHSINNGVNVARRLARWRQEGMNALMLASITQDATYKTHAAMFHWSLPPEFRFDKKLQAGALYGKMGDDLHLEGNFSRVQLCTPFDRAANSWYDFWLSKQNAIGKLDFAIGQVMLLTAIVSIILLSIGSGHLPASLENFANDPYLSVSFSLLLFAYWLDCSIRGSRMQGFVKREGKRAAIERNLALIAMGKTLDAGKKIDFKATHVANDPRIQMTPHKKSALSSYAKPTLFLGALITFLGILYLLQCTTKFLPENLSFLTENVPLSILFATTLMTTGFFIFYRGVTLCDKGHKKRVRRCTTEVSNEVVGKIYHGARANQLLQASTPRENFGTRTIKRIAIPGYVLGAFLILSSIIGVFAAHDMPIGEFLSFIKEDPSLSTFFCVTTFLFGLDAISNADRMRTYQSRKIYDHNLLDSLQKELLKL